MDAGVATADKPVEQPQQTEPTVEKPSGAEAAPAKERTYTQKEVAELQATADRREAEARRLLAQQALQMQQRQRDAEERAAQAEDRRAVAEGEISDSDARQRAVNRQKQAEANVRRAQEQEVVKQTMTQSEQLARRFVAQDFAKQYGVEEKALMEDAALNTPERMQAKALELKLQRLEAELEAAKAAKEPPEQYDSGQVGGRGIDLSTLTPAERKRERERRLLREKN